MQHKTFFGRLLGGIVNFFGSIFKHVLSGAEVTFNELPTEIKDSLIHGSGILDILNRMIGSTPTSIRLAISETFPDVDEANLESGLFSIAHFFGLSPIEGNLDDCIAKLQDHIASATGNLWDDIMHSASLLLATILSPAGTKLGALSTLLEYVYQTFINKNK